MADAPTKDQVNALDPDYILDTLKEADEQGIDIFEMSVSAGENVASQGDQANMFLGDLACQIEKSYGENRIGEWSKRIGRHADRVREYRTFSRFYPRSVRKAFFEQHPGIHAVYSKMRAAKRFKDLEYALDFVAQAKPESSCEEFEIALNVKLGKPTPAKKVLDIEVPVTSAGDELMKNLRTLMNLSSKVRIKVYEVK